MISHPKPARPRGGGHLLVLSAALMLGLAACSDDNNNPPPPAQPPMQPPAAPTVTGTVLTAWGDPVVGATVYLIPSDQIPTTPITSADVLSGASEPYDEPLEDLVTGGKAQNYPQATTANDGGFKITKFDQMTSYFPFVWVENAQPAELYPGGNLCRVALQGSALKNLDIEVTGHPTSNSFYIGSSTCLLCHPTFESQKVHAHRLGFRSPGNTTALQDLSRKPDFDDGLTYFTPGTQPSDGTPLWYHQYDGSRGFDKFVVAQADPGDAEVMIYLWQDTATSEYKITMKNLVNAEPDVTFTVDLTYGGAVYKQRYMLQVPDPGYKGRYPFLQYQHAGDDAYYDRTRKQWRDYHMDFFWDGTAKMLKLPSKTKNIERNCMACHATGYTYADDPVTGERLCDAVNDGAGAFDIDGDGNPDEINTGCEMCHGPGSDHSAARAKRFIVKPELLSPSREAQICGRCHDRTAGNDDLKNDQPLNMLGEMLPPGGSRADFVTNYTSRKGPKLSSFWADEFHSKSHHQQYPDFIKSEHYRNNSRLLACSDCHDLHGKGAYDGNLKANPHNGDLCASCHNIQMPDHLDEYTGSIKAGRTVACTDCHYYKTAKTGAGSMGLVMGPLTGTNADANIVYWENDISSHHTVIPFSNTTGVIGTVPGKAMPVPFVNKCASCHNAQLLQYQK